MTKKCSLAPCALAGLSGKMAGLGGTDEGGECDRGRDAFDCTSCCKENACNHVPAVSQSRLVAVLPLLALASSLMSSQSFQFGRGRRRPGLNLSDKG